MKHKLTETALLEAIKKGDPEKGKAIEVFFFRDKTLQNQVRRFVERHKGTSQDAEEVFDDAVVVFIQNTEKDALLNAASLIPYFLRIAKNQWFLRFRKRHPASPLTHREFEISDADVMEEEEWPEEYKQMLDFGWAKLEEQQRNMLRAKYEKGLSMQEIADTFDMSDKSMAKKYLYRFRGYLLDHMKKHPFYSKTADKKK